jgi:hypothetical protein
MLADPGRDVATTASALLLDPSGRLVDEAQQMLAFLTATRRLHGRRLRAGVPSGHTRRHAEAKYRARRAYNARRGKHLRSEARHGGTGTAS